MGYHESGAPVFRTGSIIRVPADVRVSERYGAGVKASAYSREDANGMSLGIVKDVLRGSGSRSRTLVLRDSRTPTPRATREARAARERAIAGNIGSVE